MWTNLLQRAYVKATWLVSYVRVWHVVVAVAALLAAVAVAYACVWRKRYSNARALSSVQRFVRKRGNVNSANAKRFYATASRYMPRALRRRCKTFLQADIAYRGSDFADEWNRYICMPRRRVRGLWGVAAVAIALVQAIMLMRAAQWITVYAASAAIAIAFGLLYVGLRLIERIVSWADLRKAKRLVQALESSIRTGNVDRVAPVNWSELEQPIAPADASRYRLGESVNELLDAHPDPEALAPVEEGLMLARDSAAEQEHRAYLQNVLGRLRDYCGQN